MREGACERERESGELEEGKRERYRGERKRGKRERDG
jgi:hypothetical protein